MQVIRKNIFETNSSSCHSLVIENNISKTFAYKIDPNFISKKNYDMDSIKFDTKFKVDNQKTITLSGGNFGRENYRIIRDALTKANYLATYINIYEYGETAIEYKELLINILTKITGADNVVFDLNVDLDESIHIDHDSLWLPKYILNELRWSDKIENNNQFNAVKEFIFNKNYVLISGESNDGKDSILTKELNLLFNSDKNEIISSEYQSDVLID